MAMRRELSQETAWLTPLGALFSTMIMRLFCLLIFESKYSQSSMQ